MNKKDFQSWINQNWDHMTYEQALKKYNQIKENKPLITINDIHKTIKQYEEDSNYGN